MEGIIRFFRRHSIYNIAIGMILMVILENLFSTAMETILGISYAIAIIIILFVVVLLLFFIHYTLEKRRREKLPDTFHPIGRRFKGLIVTISIIPDTPKEEVIKEIDSIKNVTNLNELSKLYDIRGIGQTLKAIVYHSKVLEVIWLLYTQKSKEEKDIVKHFIKKYYRMVKINEVLLEKPNDIKSIHRKVEEIFMKEIENYRLKEEDVVVDITGGTKTMSSAMLLACLPKERHIEYVEQTTNKIIEVESPF